MNSFGQVILSLLVCAVVSLNCVISASAVEETPPAASLDYAVLSGEWQRTDGGYLIRISDMEPDGRARVEYFNPRPIHVAQSLISTRKEFIQLFVRFQDKGYEGSTYTLYYYPEKDALAGFYYQAVLDKTFEVIFLRNE